MNLNLANTTPTHPLIPIHEAATLVDTAATAAFFPNTSPQAFQRWLREQLDVPLVRMKNGRRYYSHAAAGLAVFERLQPGMPDLMGPGYPSRECSNRPPLRCDLPMFFAFWAYSALRRCSSVAQAVKELAILVERSKEVGISLEFPTQGRKTRSSAREHRKRASKVAREVGS